MGILITILTILDVLIAIFIIALVLVQQSKSNGLGTTFGGGGSDTLFGAHAATHLTKLTVVFSTLFIVITLSLAILSSHQSKFRQNFSSMAPMLAETANTATTAEAGVTTDSQTAEKSVDVTNTETTKTDTEAVNK